MMSRSVLILFGVPALLFGGAGAAQTPDADVAALQKIRVTPLTPDQAMRDGSNGKRVRWAGAVHHIEGKCLTIMYALSNDDGGPEWRPTPTYQTFVACGSGNYDPALIAPSTNVTIVGRIPGKRSIGLGGGHIMGPVMQIDRMFRWSDCLAGDPHPTCKTGFVTPQTESQPSPGG